MNGTAHAPDPQQQGVEHAAPAEHQIGTGPRGIIRKPSSTRKAGEWHPSERNEWAFNLQFPTAVKFVALALANHADSNTHDCYPSVARLAKQTGLSVRTVVRSIATLELESQGT